MSPEVALLNEGRRREREQTAFYRFLAGDAELAGDAATAERLNELLADEQHHVSRLTARLLEMGERLQEEAGTPEIPALAGWEEVARGREAEEVAWYLEAIRRATDQDTIAILREILSSERHHHDRLAGKWMPAAPGENEDEG
jgi:rubrerythrin